VSNLTEVSRATQWKPGQSGNLNGRPVGTRQAFSADFLRDLAEVWSEEGRETMVKTARTSPATFFAAGARNGTAFFLDVGGEVIARCCFENSYWVGALVKEGDKFRPSMVQHE
jgi:hypothetical protein